MTKCAALLALALGLAVPTSALVWTSNVNENAGRSHAISSGSSSGPFFWPAIAVGIVLCIILVIHLPEGSKNSRDDANKDLKDLKDECGLEVIKPIEDYTKEELHQKVLELTQKNGQLNSALKGADEAESLQLFWPRLAWLLALLVFQSISSIILSNFSTMLERHPSIVFFLTMLVGAGGNAGGQSAVLMVRNLALRREESPLHQCRIGLGLAVFLGAATFVRTQLLTPASPHATVALCASMMVIVFTSVCIGTLMPLLLKRLNTDPAHASAMIQVLMDVVGILSTCGCCMVVFSFLGETRFGESASN